jgi:hypothetical protein
MGHRPRYGTHGKAGQPTALEWDASVAGTFFIALNTEVILPWSEPAKNWDRCLEQYKPAVRVNGRCQG